MNKLLLREKFRKIKQDLLTKLNNNSYHYMLSKNLQCSLQKFKIKYQIGNISIGSYINKPIYQIVPPIINHSNIKWCYPFFEANSKQMQFYEHKTSDLYEKGAFGIKRLANKDGRSTYNQNLDFALVPLVCFTINKNRIGQGGGYYDYFIRTHRQKQQNQSSTRKKTIFVGIGLQGLKLEGNFDNVFEKWDQKLDCIITQKSIYF